MCIVTISWDSHLENTVNPCFWFPTQIINFEDSCHVSWGSQKKSTTIFPYFHPDRLVSWCGGAEPSRLLQQCCAGSKNCLDKLQMVNLSAKWHGKIWVNVCLMFHQYGGRDFTLKDLLGCVLITWTVNRFSNSAVSGPSCLQPESFFIYPISHGLYYSFLWHVSHDIWWYSNYSFLPIFTQIMELNRLTNRRYQVHGWMI